MDFFWVRASCPHLLPPRPAQMPIKGNCTQCYLAQKDHSSRSMGKRLGIAQRSGKNEMRWGGRLMAFFACLFRSEVLLCHFRQGTAINSPSNYRYPWRMCCQLIDSVLSPSNIIIRFLTGTRILARLKAKTCSEVSEFKPLCRSGNLFFLKWHLLSSFKIRLFLVILSFFSTHHLSRGSASCQEGPPS